MSEQEGRAGSWNSLFFTLIVKFSNFPSIICMLFSNEFWWWKWEVKILCSVLTVTALLFNMAITKHSGALRTKNSHLYCRANIWDVWEMNLQTSVWHIVLKVSLSACVHLAHASHKQTWASSVHTPREVLCQDTFLGLGLWQCLMLLIKPHRPGLSTILIKAIQLLVRFQPRQGWLMPTRRVPCKYILSAHLPLKQTIWCFQVHDCIAELCQNSLLRYGLVVSIPQFQEVSVKGLWG